MNKGLTHVKSDTMSRALWHCPSTRAVAMVDFWLTLATYCQGVKVCFFIWTLYNTVSYYVGQHGTPEKPLSPLGEVSYQAYWRSVILQFLADNDTLATISIKDIADKTGMSPHDISATFQRLKMIERDQETGMFITIFINPF